ncbi:MAG: hypothetical protein ACYSU7_17765 [Planctomycetota bacterium]|jgi:hypothetical protein
MSETKTVPAGICAGAVAALLATGALGSIEMTWSNNPVSSSWNAVLNWLPPGGETPSVPDASDEAAYIKDYSGVPTTVDLDVSPTIDYLHLENPNGTLHLNGNTLSLAGPGLSVNGGLIVADPGLSTLRGSFWNMGDIELDPGSLLILDGPEVANAGVIFVNTGPGVADSAVLMFEGHVMLGHPVIPGGEVVLNGTDTQPASFEVAALSSLTNLAGHTIRGHGFVQGELTNEGVIEADPGASLMVASDLFTNRGTMNVTTLSAGSLYVEAGNIDVSGGLYSSTVVLDGGCTLAIGDPIILFGAWAVIDGTLAAAGGVELLNGTWLSGTGSVAGDVVNTSGALAPGGSAGTLEVDGVYAQDVGGRLVVELGGTAAGEYDVLSVTGVASLAGELEINALRGFVAPSVGQSFTILAAQGGISNGDTFDVLTPEWGTFTDTYDYPAGTVTITVDSWPPCVVEDVNRDGAVGIGDFLQMLAEWGRGRGGLSPAPGGLGRDLLVAGKGSNLLENMDLRIRLDGPAAVQYPNRTLSKRDCQGGRRPCGPNGSKSSRRRFMP